MNDTADKRVVLVVDDVAENIAIRVGDVADVKADPALQYVVTG